MDTLTVTTRLVVWSVLAVSFFAERAHAEESEVVAIPERIRDLSDSEVTERLDFLIERLDSGRDYAWWWWTGWTAFYGLGVVVEGMRAGLTDHEARRAQYIVGSVKAVGGVAVLLLRPPEAKDGADDVRALPHSTPDDRRRQLAVAERQLHTNAELSDRRYSWLRHAINLGVNAAGGVIIAQGFDDPSRGARSAGVGAAVGELSIWTQPWWPPHDWEEYQRRFNAAPVAQRVSWRIVPISGGAAFQLNF